MIWTIDTGVLGAEGCKAEDLRGVLEASKRQWLDNAPSAARQEIISANSQDKDALKDAAYLDRRHELGKSREAEVAAFLPKLEAQMDAAVEAACVIAKQKGGQVTATCSGHYFTKGRVDSVFKRVQVSVDRAAPTGED